LPLPCELKPGRVKIEIHTYLYGQKRALVGTSSIEILRIVDYVSKIPICELLTTYLQSNLDDFFVGVLEYLLEVKFEQEEFKNPFNFCSNNQLSKTLKAWGFDFCFS
jgi:hypothetical protein